ncbi:dTMP kinase [Lachnotalea glycerini]|uniref:Thymidylate kinase n=1 Tax=Lachnotalea glycerini TaxID=1763509 RepID=A0A371JDW8_9FIRM|nr:dTMP kinase [Lachnotalea glycerini]RDY30961.1 dTMP kinase [Lachnotalea glycerini]
MVDNIYVGKLISLDGPNGVGKSTLIEKLKERLELKEYQVYVTKEPTDTELGKFVRSYAEEHGGISLACMVAADRYEHLINEIIPQLKEGKIVIADRYILSSLILQRMDKVRSTFILNLNSEILKPDLQIAVFAKEEIIQKRLAERETLTRFEKDNQSSYELKYLEDGVRLLKERGVEVLRIVNNDSLIENVEKMVVEIIGLYGEIYD